MNGVRLDRKVATPFVAPPAEIPERALAPQAADGFEKAKAALGDEAQTKEHLRRTRESPELAELLRQAKANWAGAGRLEPEHLLLQMLKDQGIPANAAEEKQLRASALAAAGGAQGGMSDRTKLVLISASLAAGAALPNNDNLFRALLGSGEPYAAVGNGRLQEAKRDQLLAGPVLDPKQPLPKLPLATISGLADDLVAQAKEGLIDAAVGRNREVEDVFKSLGKRQLSAIVLTGDRGVGKTAIAEGMALQIARGEVPQGFENARIMKLPAQRLAEECKKCAQNGPAKIIEQLVAETAQAMRLEPPVPVILFIDEIHTLMSGDALALDIANHLKPALARGGLKIIGATTTEEYKASIRKDPALRDRLQPYEVKEPTTNDAVQMVLANLDKFAKFHGVEIDASAAQAAVDLSRYSEMKLPRGAVDWLDLAGSAVKQQIGADAPKVRRLKNDVRHLRDALQKAVGDDPDSVRLREKLGEKLEQQTTQLEGLVVQAEKERGLLKQLQQLGDQLKVELAQEPRQDARITEIEASVTQLRRELDRLPERLYHLRVDAFAVASAVADQTGIPVEKLQLGDKGKYLEIEKELGKRVIGQDEAKTAVAKRVRLDRAKLRDSNKPVGVHFFAGPTGVGKTELAKTLADEYYNGNLIRFDCNEMMQEHELAKLVGAPPGYVGFDGGSRLAEEVRKAKGHGVLLLDEIEKAHPSIFPLLMQIFDEGRLRDNEGREVDCTGLHIIMTSNLGSKSFARYAGDGEYTDEAAVRRDFEAALQQRVPPEVQGRLTSMHIFNPLGKGAAAKIFELKFAQLAQRLEGRDVTLTATQGARDALIKEGFNPVTGGRSLQKALDAQVADSLAQQILEGKFVDGDAVQVDFKAGQYTFEKVAAPRRR